MDSCFLQRTVDNSFCFVSSRQLAYLDREELYVADVLSFSSANLLTLGKKSKVPPKVETLLKLSLWQLIPLVFLRDFSVPLTHVPDVVHVSFIRTRFRQDYCVITTEPARQLVGYRESRERMAQAEQMRKICLYGTSNWDFAWEHTTGQCVYQGSLPSWTIAQLFEMKLCPVRACPCCEMVCPSFSALSWHFAAEHSKACEPCLDGSGGLLHFKVIADEEYENPQPPVFDDGFSHLTHVICAGLLRVEKFVACASRLTAKLAKERRKGVPMILYGNGSSTGPGRRDPDKKDEAPKDSPRNPDVPKDKDEDGLERMDTSSSSPTPTSSGSPDWVPACRRCVPCVSGGNLGAQS